MLIALDEREREILRLRFGLDRGEPRTLDEVGRAFQPDPGADPPDRGPGHVQAAPPLDRPGRPRAAHRLKATTRLEIVRRRKCLHRAGQGGQLEMSRVVFDARPVTAAPLSEFGLV